MSRVRTCRLRTQCCCSSRYPFARNQKQYLHFETADTDELEPIFRDIVSSKITGRNGLRLRAKAATNSCRSCLAVSKKLVHTSLCGSYSLQFSDSMSDVTCAYRRLLKRTITLHHTPSWWSNDSQYCHPRTMDLSAVCAWASTVFAQGQQIFS